MFSEIFIVFMFLIPAVGLVAMAWILGWVILSDIADFLRELWWRKRGGRWLILGTLAAIFFFVGIPLVRLGTMGEGGNSTVQFVLAPHGRPTVRYPDPGFLRSNPIRCEQPDERYRPELWRCTIQRDRWLWPWQMLVYDNLTAGHVIVNYADWGDGQCEGYAPRLLSKTTGNVTVQPGKPGCHEAWEIWVDGLESGPPIE